MAKKIKKAVKKVTGVFTKPIKGLLKQDHPAAQAVQQQAATPAQSVEVAKEDVDEDGKDTESAKKAARAKGKRGLSVSRSSGSGLNI